MTEPAPAFSVRALVRRVLQAEESEEMDVLVKAVRTAIPRNRLGDAVDEMLPEFIRREYSGTHRFRLPRPGGERPQAAGDATPDADRDAEARRAHFSAYVEKCLSDRWAVADGSKRCLGDMDASDCAYRAAKSKKDGRRLLEIGLTFEGLQSGLGEYQVRFVRELPESFLLDMFRMAA